MCGVVALALSDFVSPVYWSLSVVATLLRLWRGPAFHLSEMQASIVGWVGFAWVIIELIMGRELVVAFTDFLLILSFAIVVEAATARNHLHRMLVGLFLLLAAAVLTDSVLYVIPLLAMIWFFWRAASALYSLNWPGGDLKIVGSKEDGGWMLLVVIVTALLFIIIPRFEFHSLLKMTQPRMQTSGFSDLVHLGDFARTLDRRVIMRIESLDRSIKSVERLQRWSTGRYWRGAVLSLFTGHGWQKIAARRQFHYSAGDDVYFSAGDDEFSLIVYREASDHSYIQLPQGITKLGDLPDAVQLDQAVAAQFVRPPARRMQMYMDVSFNRDLERMQQPLRWEYDRNRTPEVVKQWMKRLLAIHPDRKALLMQVGRELRGWEYDLNVSVDAEEPVASFLQLKRGHCELFATTMALAARELGFASRVVNGYLGGDWNEVGSFMQIRSLHAHSWVEVWLDGRWQLMDATPPTRDAMLSINFPTMEQMWESLKLSWYRYVLEFQNSDRILFVQELWENIKRYSIWLVALCCCVMLIVLFYCYGRDQYRRWFRQGSDMQWMVVDRWLQKHGVQRPLFQPLRDIKSPAGIEPELWQEFVYSWEKQCYEKNRSWSKRELKRHLRALLKSY